MATLVDDVLIELDEDDVEALVADYLLTEGKSLADVDGPGAETARRGALGRFVRGLGRAAGWVSRGVRSVFQRFRQAQTRIAHRTLDNLSRQFYRAVEQLVDDFARGRTSKARMEAGLRRALEDAHRRAFDVGVRSAGLRGLVAQFRMGKAQRDWLESAVAEELKHFRKVIDKAVVLRGLAKQVQQDRNDAGRVATEVRDLEKQTRPDAVRAEIDAARRTPGLTPSQAAQRVAQVRRDAKERSRRLADLRRRLVDMRRRADDARKRLDAVKRRAAAYAKALKHTYYSGRILGGPPNMVVDWITKRDGNECLSCRFLEANGPYTPATLPTTPRAGMTCCFANCRCRLVTRPADADVLQRIAGSKLGKDWFRARLGELQTARCNPRRLGSVWGPRLRAINRAMSS